MTDATTDPVDTKPNSDELAQAQALIAQLKRQVAASTAPAATDTTGNPRQPTHLQTLACGHSEAVKVTASTQRYCPVDEAHGLQAVTAYHELATEPAA